MQRIFPSLAFALALLAVGLLATTPSPASAEDELPETSRFFEEYDKNADGIVTADEFDGSGEVFRLLDQDRDGQIKPTELGLPADYRPDPNAKKRRDDAAKARAKGGQGNQKRLERFRKLFAQWDANKDGALSKAEWRGNENAFDRFDRNKDGKIDRSDVPGLFPEGEMMGGEMMGGPKGGDDMAGPDRTGEAKPNKKPRGAKGRAGLLERLKRMDADGDGKLSRDEWKGSPQRFERMDRDGDGFVPLSDFAGRDAPRKAQHPRITPEQAAERFTLLDKDGDKALTDKDGLPVATIQKMDADQSGGVDLAEFQAAVAKAQDARTDKPAPAGKARKGNAKLIKRFDRDRDGRVSRDEFPGVDARFDSMDKDGDGYLTKADFEDAPAKPDTDKPKTDKPGDAAPITPGGDK